MAICITICSIGVAWRVRALARRSADTPIQQAFTFAWKDVPKVYADGCHLGYLDVKAPDCAFGDQHADTAIVLFGDSHAAQWFPPLERLALERHWKLVTLTKSACPAAGVERTDPALGRNYVECTSWRRAAIDRIVRLAPKAVIMASANAYVTADTRPGSVTADQWFQGTRDTLSRLSSAGLKTLLVRDTPVPGFDVPGCLARAEWNPTLFSRNCTFDRAASRNADADRAEAAAVAQEPGVSVLDPVDIICGNFTCNPWNHDLVVYRDTNHLTTQFATSLAPLISTKLDDIGLGKLR
jgi:hypothetical protein